MAKEGERPMTGLARRVEVFLDLAIFNEIRRAAVQEDTTVSKILTRIVLEHFRDRGVPRRGPEQQRSASRQAAQSTTPPATQAGPTGASPGAAASPQDQQQILRRRRRRRRGGRGPRPEGGGGDEPRG